MNTLNRRTIILRGATAAAIILTAQHSVRAAGAKLEESDPMAVGLGYREDTHKVDDKKFSKHAATQSCADCQLFQGTAKDATAACTLFGGKQVATGGWCSAWTKKAG
jgi:hypothetical protein